MAENIPNILFEQLTPSQMTAGERDLAYEQLHESVSPVHEIAGFQAVHGYDDVRAVLMGRLGDESNKNSLDPLVGYGRIIRTLSTAGPFIKGLFPPPEHATANARNDAQHRRVWNILGGSDGQFTVPTDSTAFDDRVQKMNQQFDHIWRALGYEAMPGPSTKIDVARLAIGYAALVTGEEVGLSQDDWPLVAQASEAQSGLLGQDLRGRELGIAVKGLSDLFLLCRHAVDGKTQAPISLAKRLADDGAIPRRVAISALANSLAAGVYTMGGTIPQGVERMMSDPERTWWHGLGDFDYATRVGNKILQLDPGLVAWKRYAPQAVTLDSGTRLQKGPVLALFGAANRDPAVFPDATSLDSRGKLVLTFGAGPHICPGQPLARLAIPVFLHNLHERVPEAELATSPSQRSNRRDLVFSISHPMIAQQSGKVFV